MSDYVSVDQQLNATRCYPCVVGGNYQCDYELGTPCSFCLQKPHANCTRSKRTIDDFHSTRQPIERREPPPWPGKDPPTKRHPNRQHEIRINPNTKLAVSASNQNPAPSQPGQPNFSQSNTQPATRQAAMASFSRPNFPQSNHTPVVNQARLPPPMNYHAPQPNRRRGPHWRQNDRYGNNLSGHNEDLRNRIENLEREQLESRLARLEQSRQTNRPRIQDTTADLERQLAETHAQLAASQAKLQNIEQEHSRDQEVPRRHRAFDRQRSRSPNRRPEWGRNHRQRDYSTSDQYPRTMSTQSRSNEEESFDRHRQNYNRNRSNDDYYSRSRQNLDDHRSGDGYFSRPRQSHGRNRNFNEHHNYDQDFSYGPHQNFHQNRTADHTFGDRRQDQNPALEGSRIKQEPGIKPEPNIKREPSPW